MNDKDLIRFDGARLCQGIEYHLFGGNPPFISSEVREAFKMKGIKQITLDSLTTVCDELVQAEFSYEVPRKSWRKFNNMERLSALWNAAGLVLVPLPDQAECMDTAALQRSVEVMEIKRKETNG